MIAGSEDDSDTAGLSIQIFSFSNSSMVIGQQLTSVSVNGACDQGTYTGTAMLKTKANMQAWVVTKLRNGGKTALTGVTLGVVYDSDGTLH